MPTILLVENDVQNRDLLRRWLQRWGYAVLLAPDGAQALALASSTPPDLIVMDINMPVLDGLAATTRLKAAPATQAIPILVRPANAMAGDRGWALAAGAVALEPGVHDQVYSNHQGIEVHGHRKPPAKVVTLPLYRFDTFSASLAYAGVMHHASAMTGCQVPSAERCIFTAEAQRTRSYRSV